MRLHCCFLLLIYLLTVEGADWSSVEAKCPDCEKIKCMDELVEEDCPTGTRLIQNVMFGCCPACLKYLRHGEACPGFFGTDTPKLKYKEFWSTHGDGLSQEATAYYPDEYIRETVELPCGTIRVYNDYFGNYLELPERVFSAAWQKSARNISLMVPVIDSARCEPFHECVISYNDLLDDKYAYPVCNLYSNEESAPYNRKYEEAPCAFSRADYSVFTKLEDCSVRYWEPECTVQTGLYDKVQTKSEDGEYWCSSPQGERIFGKELKRRDKMDINCKCSRKRWELRQQKNLNLNGESVTVAGRSDVSLHCEKNGNFEPLQCDNERCWCISPDTGLANSKVLPENLMRFLPCFDRAVMDEAVESQYLRKCESRSVGMQRTTSYLLERGTNWSPGDEISCDATGGFDKTLCDQYGLCYCVENTGKKSSINVNNDNLPTCSCARDFLDGIIPTQNCDITNGNYKPLQAKTSGGITLEYCIDETDGWRVSGDVPSVADKPGSKPCCLDSELFIPSEDFPGGEFTLPEFSCRKSSGDNCDSDPTNCLSFMQNCTISGR